MEPEGCCVSTLRSLHRRPVPDASDWVTVMEKTGEFGPFFHHFVLEGRDLTEARCGDRRADA